MNVLALCAGVGGVELGLKLATSGRARCVGGVERDAYAAAILARLQAATGDRFPIWDDLATFDGRPWRGRVDCITAGLPCQPYSLAGKRRGDADERALWPEFIRITEEVEPALAFIENVPGFLKHFEPAWRELRRLGFDVAPPLLHTASEAGAPHIRRRVFLLAAHPERTELRQQPGRSGGTRGSRASQPRASRSAASDTECAGLGKFTGVGEDAGSKCATAQRNDLRITDANSGGCESEWGFWILDQERETLWHDADRCGDRCRICGSPWETESPPVRVVDGPPNRADQLRCAGNGVVPLVVAAAFTELSEALGLAIPSAEVIA